MHSPLNQLEKGLKVIMHTRNNNSRIFIRFCIPILFKLSIIVGLLLFFPPLLLSNDCSYKLYVFENSPIKVVGYDFEGNVVSSRIADFRNVNWGFLYKDELYTWYKKYLFKINIAKLTNETFSLYGLNKFRIENIVGVDKDQIYFNASNLNEQINKNNTFQKKYYLFSFNQNSGLLSQVDIATDLFRVTSVANGKFYYNDINKRVFEKSGEEITLLFPNGLSPTISPNGKYIAFYIKNLKFPIKVSRRHAQ